MSLPLFDLTPEYAALADLPAESVPESQKTSFEEALDEIQDQLAPKLLALAKVVRILEAEADVLEQHARNIDARAGTRRRRTEHLKRWIHLQMEGAGLEKLKDPQVTLWLHQSPASVEVLDERLVAAEFKRATLKLPLALVPPGLVGYVHTCDVDRAAVHDLLRTTGELPDGIEYRYGRRHLRIR